MKYFVAISLLSILVFSTTASSNSELQVLKSYTIPATEISGMAWRKNPSTNARELIVVSDNEYALFVINWPPENSNLKVNRVDLQHIKRASDGKQSEWESVFSDESGRIFIVKENPARIVVVSSDFKRLEQELTLAKSFTGAANSGGEGLLPLANGHILVVNEKDPLKITEYGPPNGTPLGYQSDFSIEHSGTFPISSLKLNNLSALHSWTIDDEFKNQFTDSSGLNVDEGGKLYLLSDEKRAIGFVGDALSTGVQNFRLNKFWYLPKTVRRPEGMVIDPNNRPIIAVDKKNTKKHNLFLLSELK